MYDRCPEDGWEYQFFAPEQIPKKQANDDNSYNPLFIQVSKKTACYAMVWRFIFLLVFIFLLIPHDLYLNNQYFDFRWGFWANKVRTHTVDINSISNFTLSIQNCNLRISPNDAGRDDIRFDISTNYDSRIMANDTYLEVKDKSMNNIICNIRMKAPTQDIALIPQFNVIFNGTRSNIGIYDQGFTPERYMQFKKDSNFTVKGKAGGFGFHHHHLTKLYLHYQNIEADLHSVNAEKVILAAESGYLNFELPESIPVAELAVSQPYGSICLTAPSVYEVSNTTCPNADQRKRPVKATPSGEILDQFDCRVKARLCNVNGADCKTYLNSKTKPMSVNALINDGNIHISYQKQLKEDFRNFTSVNVDIPSHFHLEKHLESEQILESLFQNIPKHERDRILFQQQKVVTKDSQIQAISFVRDLVQFNGQSSSLLYSINDKITNNPGDDAIAKFQITGWSYNNIWLYTNKRPYFQAKVWLLSFVSLGLLKPTEYTDKLVLLDRKCPSTSVSIKKNGQIAEFLQQKLPTTAKSSVALIPHTQETDGLFQFAPKSDGSYKIIKISITDAPLILILLIIGFALTIFAAVIAVIILLKLTKLFNIEYQQFVASQRRLAVARKKLTKTQKNQNTQTQVGRKKGILGVFTGKTVLKSNQQIAREKHEAQQKLSKLKKKSISPKQRLKQSVKHYLTFFQVPQLYIETMRRRAANSLALFIQTISMSQSSFPESRFEANNISKKQNKVPGQTQDFNRMPKILLSKFQQKYSQFCTIFGYRQLILQDQQEMFQKYGIHLQYIQDRRTKVYTKIRWKQDNEKRGAKSNKDTAMPDLSSVKAFLNDMCQASKFKNDYILMRDLKAQYEVYCNNYGITGIKKEPLVGNKQLIAFRAVMDSIPIPYLLNIKQPVGIITDLQTSSSDAIFDSGFIRKNNLPKKGDLSKFKRFKIWFNQLKTQVWSTGSPLSNCLLVIAHIASILVVALPLLIIVGWAIVENSFVSPHMSSQGYQAFTIYDLFSPDSFNPWWEGSSQVELATFIIFLLFVVIALIQLCSYYATFFSFTGSIQLFATKSKKILSGTFWVFALTLIVIYIAYVCLVALWMVLGAILNPNKFLPFASAVGTFALFIASKISAMNSLIDELQNKLEQFIEDQLRNLISSTMNSVLGNDEGAQALTDSLIQGDMDKAARLMFYKAIVALLGENVSPSAQQREAIINGDMNALISLVSQGIGLHQAVVKSIIGICLHDNRMIIQCVGQLSKQIGMDEEIGQSLAEITLQSMNIKVSQSSGQMNGSILVPIKKLFRKVFPILPPDLINTVFQLIFANDPSPFSQLIKKNSLKAKNRQGVEVPLRKVNIIDLSTAFLQKKQTIFQNRLTDVVNDLLPHQQKVIFEQLLQVQKGVLTSKDSLAAINSFSKKLNYPLKSILHIIIAFQKKDPILSRIAIQNMMDQLFTQFKLTPNLQQKLQQSKKNLLALFSLIHGRKFSQQNLVDKLVGFQYNRHMHKAFIGFIEGDLSSIAIICDALNISQAKSFVVELYCLIHHKQTMLPEITKSLGLEPKYYEVVQATIDLLSGAAELSIFMRDNQMRTQTELYFNRLKDFQKIHALGLIRCKLEQAYSYFLKHNILEVHQFQVGSTQFLDIYNEQVLHDIQMKCTINGIDHEKANILARIYKLFSIQHQSEISLVSRMLRKQIPINGFNALRSIALIVFSINIQTLPIWDQQVKQPFKFQAVRKRKEWTEQHQKWLSEFLKIDIGILNFLLDTISGNPYLIFQIQYIRPTTRKDGLKKAMIQDDQRISIMTQLLKCTKIGITYIGGIWAYQYDLIQKGWLWISTVCRKMGLPSSFVDMIRSSKEESSLKKEFSKRQFQETIKTFIESRIDMFVDDNMNKVPDDVPQDMMKAVYSSPLDVGESVDRFKQILKIFIDIKNGKKSMLMERLGYDKEVADNLSRIIEYLNRPSDMGFYEIVFDFAGDVDFFGRDLIEAEDSKSLQGKLLFIHLALFQIAEHLYSGAQASADDDDDDKQDSAMSKPSIFLIEEIVQMTKKFLDQSQQDLCKEDRINYYQGAKLPSSDIFQNLFELNIYNFLSKRIFKRLGLKNLKSNDFDAILGLIIGSATSNKDLVRNCILQFLDLNKFEKVVYSGLISIAQKSNKLDKQIKTVAKKLDLKPSIAQALMHLSGNDLNLVKDATIHLGKAEIGKDTCQVIASFISLMKGSVMYIGPLAQKLGVKSDVISPIMAATLGQLDNIISHLPKIAKSFKIGNFKAVELILRIANGDCSKIQDIAKSQSRQFQMHRTDVAEALIYIRQIGQEKFEQRPLSKAIKSSQLNWAVRVLVKQLSWAIGYKRAEQEKIGKDQNVVNEEVKGEDSSKEEIKLEQQQELNIQQDDMDNDNTILNDNACQQIQNHLQADIRLLIEAVWDDPIALEALSMKIAKKSKNPIWTQYAYHRSNILSHAIKRIAVNVRKQLVVLQHVTNYRAQKPKDLIRRIRNTNSQKKIDELDLTKFPKKLRQYFKLAQFQKQKLALKCQCTYNSTHYQSYKQTYWKCQTCAQNSGSQIGVCQACAVICHSGHQLRPGNSKKAASIVCDCGSGKFIKSERQLANLQINNHQWREMMMEKDKCFCFFNQQVFRSQPKELKNLQRNLYGDKNVEQLELVREDTSKNLDESQDLQPQVQEQNEENQIINQIEENYPPHQFMYDLEQSLTKILLSSRSNVPLKKV